MSNKEHDIKLVALDLDGTLFDSNGNISQGSIDAIKYAIGKGVHVVIASGRHFEGLNLHQLEGVPLSFAITTNGAGVYNWQDGTCLFEEPLTKEQARELIQYLGDQKIFTTAFSGGTGIVPDFLLPLIPELPMPENLKINYYPSLTYVPDLMAYAESHTIQKFCFNFFLEDEKTNRLLGRADLQNYMTSRGDLEVVCGGFENLECTRMGVNKGKALLRLAEHLGLTQAQTMAIGDTENDLAIIKAAGVGVAMANGDEEVKAAADYITSNNDEDGVAKAIYHFI